MYGLHPWISCQLGFNIWLVGWLVGFGFLETEYLYVALAILKQISCDPSASASPSASISDVCHQTQLPCVPVGSQKPSLSVWLLFIMWHYSYGHHKKKTLNIFSFSELCIFWTTWVFSERALDSATTKVSKILKLLKNKKSSANFEIQLLQNVKTHDVGFWTKHASLALPYLLWVWTHGLNR